jgi:hypothetical protein
LGLRTRSGADDVQASELFRQLREDRADTAGCADDQQALAFIDVAFAYLQAFEEQFPRGDGGQRQGGRFGEPRVLGMWPTIRSSTTCSSLLPPARAMEPA